MRHDSIDRRGFVMGALGSAAAVAGLKAAETPRLDLSGPVSAERVTGAQERTGPPRLRFAVIGLDHPHIYSQVTAVQRGGGELVWVHAQEPGLLAQFTKRFPAAKVARTEDEILQDSSIALVVSAIVPDARAPLGIRVMRAGKDYMADKPGITSLEQLDEVRRVQAETRRIYSIMYSERLENRATVRAGELVAGGAIGRVVQTIGLGPHRISLNTRPAWFWDKARFGGILCDIASHQADQFLFFTKSTSAKVIAAQVANVNHPQYPKFEDFGDMMVRGDGGSGYVRVDWFTPDGLATWGDGRLTILGTDGFIEIRKNIDIAGRPGDSHLFLVDHKETRYVDCTGQPLPYGTQLVDDVLNRTETAMSQAHCLLAMQLVLEAQKQAV
jgi:predicted dehydrogenase